MKISKVFLTAAELVDIGHAVDYHPGCCWAMRMASHQGLGVPMLSIAQTDVMQKGFAAVFQPKSRLAYWFGATSAGSSEYGTSTRTEKKNRQRRVFAMLLMHELAKDVGL